MRGRTQVVDPAVERARRVVGLYGDPSVTWSVVARLRLRKPADPTAIRRAADEVHAAYPHLGPPPEVRVHGPQETGSVLAGAADQPFGDAGPLTRVSMAADGEEVVVAVHHGCADGLGLLGYAGALLRLDLPSSARGVPASAEPRDFLRGSVRRLGEALRDPPVRVASQGRTGERGDVLLSRDIPVGSASTAALVLAATRAVRGWNGPGGRARRPVVVAMGISRRPGTPMPAPDRDTAFARLVTTDLDSLTDARRLLTATRPEPAFPVTKGGGLGPLVVRVLAGRLGSTLLVSNLGRIDQSGLERVEFWPVPAGPAGVCLGLASSPSATTLTARLRRAWFSEAEASSWADLVAAELVALSRSPQ